MGKGKLHYQFDPLWLWHPNYHLIVQTKLSWCLMEYCKIQKISPKRPSFKGLFLEGHIFKGATRREICVTNSVGLDCSWKGIYGICDCLYTNSMSFLSNVVGFDLDRKTWSGRIITLQCMLGHLAIKFHALFFPLSSYEAKVFQTFCLLIIVTNHWGNF